MVAGYNLCTRTFDNKFLFICWIAYWQCTSETAITENAYLIFCYLQAIQFAEQALIFADMQWL